MKLTKRYPMPNKFYNIIQVEIINNNSLNNNFVLW